MKKIIYIVALLGLIIFSGQLLCIPDAKAEQRNIIVTNALNEAITIHYDPIAIAAEQQQERVDAIKTKIILVAAIPILILLTRFR
jgi:hypothetical protein